MPLISIITVVKDDFDALRHTLVGVLSGFTDDIEWIIVDGTPNREQVELIAKEVSFPVTIISESDKGPYDAMNKGTAIAAGEWLLYMNAGDKPFITNTLLDFISMISHKGIVYSDTLYAFKKRSRLKKTRFNGSFHSGMPFCHQSVLFSDKLKPHLVYNTDYTYAADYDLLLSLKNNLVPMDYYPGYIAEVDPYGISNLNQVAVTREQVFIAKSRGIRGCRFHVMVGVRYLLAGLADVLHVFRIL